MLVLAIFLGTASVFYGFLEKYFYPNYIYSQIGLNPIHLYFATALIFSTYFLRYTKSALPILALFIIGYSAPGIIGSSLALIVKTAVSQDTSADQMVSVFGEKYRFIIFLESTTPLDSKILIPPNTLPWRHTGDVYLMQAWLYPRKIYTASYGWVLEPDSFKIFDFILISSESDGTKKGTWPDFYIPARKIIIYDWERDTGVVYENRDYDPREWQNKQPWGLIIQKKT